ncbi:DUF2243 domain-containing protein [Paenibacillus xanthanilyticus]|uniref:DUF2243 domain-containing protein n=1 Tax=Paenibacillus xanthanilyticus TaxID=1783531 RepID=A0ABV8K2R3_9BACL
MPTQASAPSSRRLDRNLLSGWLFGLGFVAFIDETVFHQLLHWHHFYDKATTNIGLVSDGLFHAFSWFATIISLFQLAELRRGGAWNKPRWLGASWMGAGVFQLYDGLIQHKLMRLHQIRYVANVAVYDIIWNALAACILLAGIAMIRRASGATHEADGARR